MYLYVVRHALAEEREFFAKKKLEDSLRPLTVKGKKRMQKMISRLKFELRDVELIVTSPFARAKQTAEIISVMLGGAKVIESAELVPHALPRAFINWLRVEAKDKRHVMIVGHEPHLSSLVSLILSGKEAISFIDLKKSSMALLETGNFDEMVASKANLLWLVSPKLVERLSK